MIHIIKDGEGEYDDYHEFVVTVLRGKKCDLGELAQEYHIKKEEAYQKVRTKGMPKHLKWDLNGFIEWLIANHGFNRVLYTEWMR